MRPGVSGVLLENDCKYNNILILKISGAKVTGPFLLLR